MRAGLVSASRDNETLVRLSRAKLDEHAEVVIAPLLNPDVHQIVESTPDAPVSGVGVRSTNDRLGDDCVQLVIAQSRAISSRCHGIIPFVCGLYVSAVGLIFAKSILTLINILVNSLLN